MIHVVTYATHSEGLYDQLINNNYGVDVITLGWGKPWSGFTDRSKGLLEHVKKLAKDDIVVFVDGWDTVINRDPSDLEDIFNSFNCDILFSKNYASYPNITKIVFKTCKNNTTVNGGMFMGRVSNIQDMLQKLVKMSCKDDQVNMNKLCGEIPSLEIDMNDTIFQNTYVGNPNPTGIFVSYPGSVKGRIIRGIREYSQFFETFSIILLLLLIIIFPKHRGKLLFVTYLLVGYHFMNNDRSCI